jgi:putative transposase
LSFGFRHRLQAMSARFIGRKVHVVEERYTSKTCSRCGWIDNKLGSAKTFTCKREGCGRVMDRDWNASLNILLKHVERYVGRVVDVIPSTNSNSNW